MGEAKTKKPARATGPHSEGQKESSARPGKESESDTRQWFEALENVLEYVLKQQHSERAPLLMQSLLERLRAAGIKVPPSTLTPYLNTIPVEPEPAFPVNWQVPTRI